MVMCHFDPYSRASWTFFKERTTMGRIKRLIQFCVAVAGILNAGTIGLQALDLMEMKNSAGHNVGMYFVFLFIQISLVANAAIHKDKWQASAKVFSRYWLVKHE